jgi:threonine dehydrogenase-like Zn-dependent dehydrogenase
VKRVANVRVDAGGHAHRASGLDGEALVLVRPDGPIGLLACRATAHQVAA